MKSELSLHLLYAYFSFFAPFAMLTAQNEAVNPNQGGFIDQASNSSSLSNFSDPSQAQGFGLSEDQSLLDPVQSTSEYQDLLKTFQTPVDIEAHQLGEQSLVDPKEKLEQAARDQQSLIDPTLKVDPNLQEGKETSSQSLVEPQEGRLILEQFLKPQPIKLSPKEKLVEASESITDFETKLTLAKLFIALNKELEEAFYYLTSLIAEQPSLPVLHLELGKLYLKQENYRDANGEFEIVLNLHPLPVNLMVELATEEIHLGHMKLSQILFEEALAKTDQLKQKEEIEIDYASNMLAWGDFYKAENILRQALEHSPSSSSLLFKLAVVMISAQRYEEAEQIYQLLRLQNVTREKATHELAQLKLLEKDFDSALCLVGQLIKISRDKKKDDYILLQGNILFQQGSYTDALEVYQQLIKDHSDSSDLLVKIAKVYLKQGMTEAADFYLKKAHDLKPYAIEIAFYSIPLEARLSSSFIQGLINDSQSAAALNQWAGLYQENGYAQPAMNLYQAAIQLDSDHFSARLSLAQLLPLYYHYKDALKLYKELLQEFPVNPKLMLEKARVISWSKKYKQALKAYDQLIALNPKNPVPIREKGRVAFWAKEAALGLATFQTLLIPTVDQLILKDLAVASLNLEDERGQINYESDEIITFYQVYEQLQEQICSSGLTGSEEERIRYILAKHVATYLIQKALVLEAEAKWLIWDKRYIQALDVLEALIEFMPGNEEAIFDYAQDLQTVGFCQEAPIIYKHLLQLTPLHNIAKLALKRTALYLHPSLLTPYSYWHEFGRGELSDITRQRWKVGVDYALSCQTHLICYQNRWIETPYLRDKIYPANGPSFEINHRFAPYFSGSASLTQKVYEDANLHSYCLGFLKGWYGQDRLNLGLGYERGEELPNYFAVIQEIRTDTYWIGCKIDITRKLHFEETYRYVRYSDRNYLHHVFDYLSYQLTEFPTIFKLIGEAEYRNTAYKDIFIYAPNNSVNPFVIPDVQFFRSFESNSNRAKNLDCQTPSRLFAYPLNNSEPRILNIIHPYWTPQHYFAWRFTLDFRHDYADLEFYESEKRYFSFKFMTGNDTEKNRAYAWLIEWRHDFMERWSLEVQTLIHRSEQWDAEGVWATLRYYF